MRLIVAELSRPDGRQALLLGWLTLSVRVLALGACVILGTVVVRNVTDMLEHIAGTAPVAHHVVSDAAPRLYSRR